MLHASSRTRERTASGVTRMLIGRDVGTRPSLTTDVVRGHRIASLGVSCYNTIQTSSVSGVLWLDLDTSEQRYLLAGAADTTVEVFDMQETAAGSGYESVAVKPVASIKRRRHPSAHQSLVTSVTWYPVDNGLFVTGSYDKDVKVWDANM
eukprot:jgi/Chrzof1/11921/Cz06g14210.t1